LFECEWCGDEVPIRYSYDVGLYGTLTHPFGARALESCEACDLVCRTCYTPKLPLWEGAIEGEPWHGRNDRLPSMP